MSIWFSKRERNGRATRFSASVPFTLIFMLIAMVVFALLSLLGRL